MSLFHMTLENVVVSTLGPDGRPALTNAGEERFQGFEGQVTWAPPSWKGFSLGAGYAHHDATYVSFSFVTPDGELVVVDGKRVELVPRDLWNVRLAWAPKSGLGFWGAVRHQGIRPYTRRNTASTRRRSTSGTRASRGRTNGCGSPSPGATSATTATS